MRGDDIEDLMNHLSLADGNLTLYFATAATRAAYPALPTDHPSLHLP